MASAKSTKKASPRATKRTSSQSQASSRTNTRSTKRSTQRTTSKNTSRTNSRNTSRNTTNKNTRTTQRTTQRATSKSKKVQLSARERRMQAQGARKLDPAAIALRVAAILAVVLVAGIVTLYFLRNSSLTQIRAIDAEASEHVSAEDIAKLAEVGEGTTLLNVDLDAVAQNIMKNPWVAAVDVERVLPDKLYICVYEREIESMVLMSTGPIAWYLGNDDVWIEPVSLTVSADQTSRDAALARARSIGAQLICDIPATLEPEAGKKTESEEILAVCEYLDGFSDEFKEQIAAFSATSVESISCTLQSGIEVSLGEPSSIAAKEAIIRELVRNYPGEITYINVRVPSSPAYRRIDNDSVQEGSGL